MMMMMMIMMIIMIALDDGTEKKTRTIPDEGDCPIFEESLEFYIHQPDMALIRFIVLDDEFIGDDFIGQYTIPFPCMRTGNSIRYLVAR